MSEPNACDHRLRRVVIGGTLTRECMDCGAVFLVPEPTVEGKVEVDLWERAAETPRS